MKRFNNILVIIGEEQDSIENPAFKRGLALAKNNQAKLTLMDVIPAPKQTISNYKAFFKPQELTEILIKRRKESLQQIVEQIDHSLDIDIKVAVGQGFIEIIRQVILEQHDLLIKVANAYPSSFDSSDFNLMRKCPQPVWLIKPEHEQPAKKVLAAIDLSLENDKEGKAFNADIMDVATTLAHWENSECHILSCWDFYGESHLRNGIFMKISETKLDELIQEEAQVNHRQQQALVDQYPNTATHSHLIKGHPKEVIPDFIQEQQIDTVVMGTVARSGIPGLLIGNTSETILKAIDASVITLKPDGFESIIK